MTILQQPWLSTVLSAWTQPDPLPTLLPVDIIQSLGAFISRQPPQFAAIEIW